MASGSYGGPRKGITDAILGKPSVQETTVTSPPLSGPGSGYAPSNVAGAVKATDTNPKYSKCDETHVLSTIEDLQIVVGQAVFVAGGQALALAPCGRAQVFEVIIQSDTPGGYQLFEGGTVPPGGGNIAGGQPISGHWQLSANQFLGYGGKIVNGNIALVADQASTVQFEIRYRLIV